MKSPFDKLDELTEKIRAIKQRLAGQEQDTRQPRLAMEADVPPDTKTRKRMEAAAAANRVISAGNSSALVNTDPIRLISFGENYIGPPALPCSRDEVLVDNGAVAPKPRLSPADMCTRTASGGLLPNGTASTATTITYYQPRSRLFPTEETNAGTTSLQYATYISF